jgi:hypothetical protein
VAIDAEPIPAGPIDAEPIPAGPIDAEAIDTEPVDAAVEVVELVEAPAGDAVALDDRPTLSFLHLLLPHGPWRLYPDGQPYATTSYPVGDYDDSSGEPWVKAMRQQRHLLQAEYADHLVGEIIATLKRTGAYDDSLIVAMADHGVAFRHGSDARLWDDETAPDIAYSPLIIKAPGQTNGGADDQNVTSLDVLPTIADLLDVPVPWTTEGAPAGSAEVRGRDGHKRIVDRGSWGGPTERHVHEFTMAETQPSVATRLIPPAATAGADPSAPRGVLDGLLEPLHVAPFVGRPLDELATTVDPEAGAAAPSATLVAPAPAAEPEGLVRGTVAGVPDDSVVLVAVGGRVVTAAPLIVLDGQAGTFLALLPPDALLAAVDRTTVELAVVHGAGTGDAAVQRIAITG